MFHRRLLAGLALFGALACAPLPGAFLSGAARAETFRWAGGSDAASLDPHSLAEAVQLGFLGNIYEGLVRRDLKLQAEPALATSWRTTAPGVWRFDIRRNVRFADGTPLTADDVVFSFRRAMAPAAGVRGLLTMVRAVEKVDEFTVDFHLHAPDAIFPLAIPNILVMSKAWAEANGATESSNPARRAENHATRNANGTGPFRITERRQGELTVMAPNPHWWDRAEHGITRAEFRPIAADATRIAALLSREVDLIYPVPPQVAPRITATSGLRLIEQPETRTIFLAFNHGEDELKHSDVRGRNPFRDARVRRAFYQAIDADALVRGALRGKGQATGLLIGPQANGFTAEADRRLPVDIEGAKRLLAEAGYPNGFAVTLDCPNDRFVNDEQVCLALAPMLARIGIRLTVNAMPRAQYFRKLAERDTSFFLLGWAPGTLDAHHTMRFIIRTPDAQRGLGTWNYGRFSDAETDRLIDAIAIEQDVARRNTMIQQVWARQRELVAFLPLYHQVVSWGHRDGIVVGQRAVDYFDLRNVRMRRP